MVTDDVLAKNQHKILVCLQHVQDLDGSEDYVLIEGDSGAFKFLGELFTAMADQGESCTRAVHPNGAGMAHFVAGSDLGFMLHRNDCGQSPSLGRSRSAEDE
ncbi:MAG TPA: hypothetical protein VF126_09750 [Acidobacteriaceae bacterium]